MVKNKKKKREFGAAVALIFILIGVMLLSFIFSLIGFQGDQTYISNNSLESSMVVVKNIFSKEGISFFFGNFLTNFQSLEIVGLLIISIMGVSIGETSGLFKAIFSKFKNIKLLVLTFFVLLLSILMTCIDLNIYVLLIPLIAVMYKEINRNPILGVITVFIGTTLGSGACALFNHNTYSLGILTQLAATIDVDKNYLYNFNSSLILLICSLIIITFFATFIIKKCLFKDYGKFKYSESAENVEVEMITNKKATNITYIVFGILLLIIAYMIIPNLFSSGMLLDDEEVNYSLKLLGTNSPFRISFIYIFTIMIMALSYIYGRLNGTFKNSNEYSYGLFKEFSGVGYVFVLLFLLSQIIAVIEWTNIANVIVVSLINLISSLEFSGVLLIISLMIIGFIITLILPDKLAVWTLMSPLIIPLFMRANITPDFTQFIYNVSSSISLSFTPLYPALIILLAYINKYTSDDEKFSFRKIYRLLSSSLVLLAVVWIMIILAWYIVGIPIGVGVHPTL